jgi:hypothetical protein
MVRRREGYNEFPGGIDARGLNNHVVAVVWKTTGRYKST